MAHRIIYKPGGIILSSQIGDIAVSADGAFVDVRLIAPGNIPLLSERFYAYGGGVTLFDIASLIEDEMRSSGKAYADFTLTVGTDAVVHDTHTLHVLYCDRHTLCTATDIFLAENFLTTLQHRRVAPGDTLSLFFFALPGDTRQADILFSYRNVGTDTILQRSLTLHRGLTATAAAVFQLDISQAAMLQAVAASTATKPYRWEIVSFSVRVAARSLTAYIDQSLDAADTFIFRNCFNVWDATTLPVATTAKTDVERSTAVINTRSTFYNQRAAKSYETVASPLTSDEAGWIDQLFTSREVMRFEPNPCDDTEPLLLAPVLITDTDCEISLDGEKPNFAKFTWRYADNRPVVRLSASPGIFRSEYTLPFS